MVLQADSEGLRALLERLEAADVPHRAIRESDPPYDGDLLAVGLCPAPRNEVRKYVSSLPLLV